MSELRKYGVLLTTAKAIQFTLYQIDGVDIEPAAIFATGDIKISKDGGAEANTTNLPTDEGQGYRLILTAAELTATRVRLFIVDQTATKVWLDIEINIETHGHASAMYVTDFDEVMRGTDSAATETKQDIIDTNVDTLLTRIIGTLAAGTHNPATTAQIAVLSDWINGGRLDLLLDAIKVVTDALPDSGALTTLLTHLTDIKGGTFSGATDSLEAIRNRGDTAWLTATGFATEAKQDAQDIIITEARLTELDAANLPADIAAVPTAAQNRAEMDSNSTKLTSLDSRLPAALVGGKMNSDAVAVGGSTDGATRLGKATQANVYGTIGSGSTTTSLVTSALDPAAAAIDQFKGKIVTFDANTVTANLRGQSTDITANTAGGILTVTALTTAAVSGDIFVIT